MSKWVWAAIGLAVMVVILAIAYSIIRRDSSATVTVAKLFKIEVEPSNAKQNEFHKQVDEDSIMLQIEIPRHGDKVGPSEIVSGVTTIRDRNLYLVVIPMLTGDKYIVDGPLHVDSTGAWSGRARFGEGKKGIGERFAVSIIATDLELDERVLDNLSPNTQIFNSIEVERVK